MPYLWIFLGCYAATLVTMFCILMSKTASMVRAMQLQGVSEAGLEQFRSEMFPKTCVVLLWSTFFTGSILGAIGSGIFWISQ
jgi:hypothetical protein